ncbi:MAG: GNAT family N-acetyltransferase [Candidatus Omnitrophica bacterium]|nr:hypothetical protein [bacterium]NUN96072.1 GNAT family N-acetyltransferase [Candidatus Omnitrophota bacterium]
MGANKPRHPLEGVSLRRIEPSDLPFLSRVYASTRWEELAPVPWTDEQKLAFLEMQFQAQHKWYQEVYDGADLLVVLLDQIPAGRLYLFLSSSEIRIVDIALLPEFRGRGVGGELLRLILAEAGETGRKASIHVEKMNPARRLYDRLGFRITADKGVYDFWEWNASQ